MGLDIKEKMKTKPETKSKMKNDNQRRFGDTVLGQGLGVALIILALLCPFIALAIFSP